jgi:hypothetical protein
MDDCKGVDGGEERQSTATTESRGIRQAFQFSTALGLKAFCAVLGGWSRNAQVGALVIHTYIQLLQGYSQS